MMTSKSDSRGHPGLKLCVHVSVMGYYRFINFHQNRRGSGIFLGDFTWNGPDVSDTIHADLLALFALNIAILLADVTKPEKSKIMTLT